MNRLSARFCLVLALLVGAAGYAQSLNPAALLSGQPDSASNANADPLGRDTPRGTIYGFLRMAERGNLRGASEYLQFPANVTESERTERARQLKTIFDRELRIDLNRVNGTPDGRLDDGLAPDVELIGVVESTQGPEPVELVRVTGEDSRKIWQFSPGTVERIPALASRLTGPAIEKLLPAPLVTYTFLAIKAWQWIGLLALPPLAFVVVFVVARLARMVYVLVRRTRHKRVQPVWWQRTRGPMQWMLALLVALAALPALEIPILYQNYISRLLIVQALLVLVLLLVRVVNLATERIQLRYTATSPKETLTLLMFSRRLIQALILMFGLLAVVRTLGANVDPALAFLGIAGVAVALASQKTLENLFGGVSILSDKALRVGDYCDVGGVTGTVEFIGLRSTRIRTLNRTVVTYPNGQLSTVPVENYAHRDKFLCKHLLGFRYETTADQMRYILAKTREMLYSHPKVENDSARIRFLSYGDSSLNAELFCYLFAADYADYLAVQEDILLRVMNIVEESGSGFAFPSRTVYLGHDDGLDADKSKAAEAAVREWREKGELPFPHSSEEGIRKAQDGISYPPEGSVLNRRADGGSPV